MPARRLLAALLTGSALVVAACSPVRQIETAPPRPATPGGDEPAPLRGAQAPLRVVIETGSTALTDEVDALRFRVSEVLLKPADSTWISFQADANRFELTQEGRLRQVVLTTRVPPVVYDSLALVLDDLYVTFDEGAGGPLARPPSDAIPLALDFEADNTRPTFVYLTLEPGASLTRTPSCRWIFLPFVTARVE